MADIDFANSESRMNYLKENLGQLMQGIDKNYGSVMMEELMRRLEKTVSDFNEEVKVLLGRLQGVDIIPMDNIMASSAKPEPMIQPADLKPDPVESFDSLDVPELEPTPAVNEVEVEIDLDDDAMSEFEKRLKELDS